MAPLPRCLALAASLTLVTLPACGGGTSTTTLPPEAPALLAAAAEVMADIDFVQFSIERQGAPVYIDDADVLEFQAAEGRFAAPFSADAVVRVKALGLTTQIGAVGIDGEIWLSNPVTGAWEPAPDDFTFDPATLFDAETGWRPLLAEGYTDVELVELDEDGDDVPHYRLRGLADETRVRVITGGLVRESVILDLWIDATTGEVRRAEFETTTSAGVSQWTLDLFDYGTEVEIRPPDLES